MATRRKALTQAKTDAPAPVVYVIDDDAATRDAMQALFDSASVACRCYPNAEAFIAILEPGLQGCLILDLRMPGMSGLELQRLLRERACRLPIIFLTGHGKVSAAVRAMHAGAMDFLTKPVDDEALLEAVRDAIRQDHDQREAQRERDRFQVRLATLTPREQETLDGVARGLSNKHIARELDISHKTVELHRAHMMEKMQAHSIAEVVQMYLLADGSHGLFLAEEEE